MSQETPAGESAKFETWMRTRYKPGCAQLQKDSDGDYTHLYTMMEWAGRPAPSSPPTTNRANMLRRCQAQP